MTPAKYGCRTPTGPISTAASSRWPWASSGAAELNYSSDIDLILLYDATAPVYAGGRAADSVGSFTSRLARDLITLMEARDANGYVFRTDLRLRPDPAATPPAVSLHAALIYYETMGQNWERAAMIKARPVAGDLPLGHRFLEAIRPFVWRRGLDFAAVADIHAMKRRIDVAKKTALGRMDDPVARIAGHNVKLGEGGIREIEFLVQTLQMVWGGRDPTLRVKPTLPAMARLVGDRPSGGGRPPPTGGRPTASCARSSIAFRWSTTARPITCRSRRARWTRSPASWDIRMRRPSPLDFLRHVDIVRANYRAVFEHVPDLPGTEAAGPELDFRGDDPGAGGDGRGAEQSWISRHEAHRHRGPAMAGRPGAGAAIKPGAGSDDDDGAVDPGDAGAAAEPGRGLQSLRPVH